MSCCKDYSDGGCSCYVLDKTGLDLSKILHAAIGDTVYVRDSGHIVTSYTFDGISWLEHTNGIPALTNYTATASDAAANTVAIPAGYDLYSYIYVNQIIALVGQKILKIENGIVYFSQGDEIYEGDIVTFVKI